MGVYYLETKTRQQVAEEYCISVKTLNRRLKKANISVNPGVIFPKTLEEIYSTFGVPKKVMKSNEVQ
jgi:DNA-binding transcriptional regulator LsrR (DeoR family)